MAPDHQGVTALWWSLILHFVILFSTGETLQDHKGISPYILLGGVIESTPIG